MPRITPNLWFDTQGEEAARYYCDIFPSSGIVDITRYGPAGPREEGTVMTVIFELDGHRFVALNGGPELTFDEAVSLEIDCADQAEVDYYWDRLSDGGREGPCGWVTDRFGLSWQVVPRALYELLGDPDTETVRRVTTAMLAMGKLDVAELRRAAEERTVEEPAGQRTAMA